MDPTFPFATALPPDEVEGILRRLPTVVAGTNPTKEVVLTPKARNGGYAPFLSKVETVLYVCPVDDGTEAGSVIVRPRDRDTFTATNPAGVTAPSLHLTQIVLPADEVEPLPAWSYRGFRAYAYNPPNGGYVVRHPAENKHRDNGFMDSRPAGWIPSPIVHPNEKAAQAAVAGAFVGAFSTRELARTAIDLWLGACAGHFDVYRGEVSAFWDVVGNTHVPAYRAAWAARVQPGIEACGKVRDELYEPQVGDVVVAVNGTTGVARHGIVVGADALGAMVQHTGGNLGYDPLESDGRIPEPWGRRRLVFIRRAIPCERKSVGLPPE